MGQSAFGTTFEKVPGGLDPNIPIAELTNISGPGLSADTIDVTSHDSADGYREYVQRLKDGGEVSLEGNFTGETGQDTLYSDFNTGTAINYLITFPTTPAITWAFSGIVTALSTEAPFDGKLSFSATVKVSGKPTLA